MEKKKNKKKFRWKSFIGTLALCLFVCWLLYWFLSVSFASAYVVCNPDEFIDDPGLIAGGGVWYGLAMMAVSGSFASAFFYVRSLSARISRIEDKQQKS